MYNSNFDICVAGALAAVIVDFAVYPFDTLKTRLQSPDYEKLYKDSRTGAVRRNVLFKGLYQGMGSVVASTIPSSGAFFTTYEAVKHALANTTTLSPQPECNRVPIAHSLPTPLAHAVASLSAESVACLMITPAEVVKQNAQVVEGPVGGKKDMTPPVEGNSSGRAGMEDKYRQKREGRRSVAKGRRLGLALGLGAESGPTVQVMARFKHKPRKLWSGYFALVSRNLPFTGLQFPLFEFVRARVVEAWVRREKNASPTNSEGGGGGGGGKWNQVIERAGLTGLSASVSGTIASIITTPVDVVKTRVMLSAGNGVNAGPPQASEKSSGSKSKGPSSLAVARQILRDEGVKGLFRGGALRAGWTAVALSMYLSIYEGSRFYLENRRKERDNLRDTE